MFHITLIFIFVIINSGESVSLGRREKLMELKDDVKQLGVDFENLVFNFVRNVMDETSVFEVDGDYYTGEDNIRDLNNAIEKESKIIENTTKQSTTLKTVLENYTESSLLNRIKRSVEDNSISDLPKESNITEAPTNLDQTQTCQKHHQEQALESQHIEDLKEEVKKLHDLVVLLRDQQQIIALLDEDTENINSDLSKRFDTKDLIKILEHVNNKYSSDRPMQRDVNSAGRSTIEGRKPAEIIIEDRKATHEELEKIKFDIREAIAMLNKTKNILVMERKKEVELENDLKEQKQELNFLKIVVGKLYQNGSIFPKEINPEKGDFPTAGNEIVGLPAHLPKTMPESKPMETKGTKSDKVSVIPSQNDEKLRNSNEMAQQPQRRQNARASELDSLDRLIHQISQPKKDEIESKMFELQQEIDQKKQEQDLIKQLALLQKLLAQQKEAHSSSSSDSEMLKRLQIALKNTNKPQSRIDDDDLELELQKLQDALNNLRPKDEFDLSIDTTPPKVDDKELQILVNKLLSQQSKKDEGTSSAANKGHQLSAKEIADLRKKLQQMTNGNKNGVDNIFSSSNGYAYGPQFSGPLSGKYICKIVQEDLPQSNSDITSPDFPGRGPYPPQYAPGYGNFGPNYPPFANPQYSTMNHDNYGIYARPNSGQFNSYFPPSNRPSVSSQYFGFNPYRSPPQYQHYIANAAQDAYEITPNIPQKAFRPNYGSNLEENIYQSPPILPNQYNLGPNIEKNNYRQFGNPSQFQPGPKPLPYTQANANNQIFEQQPMKNQFFPAPQSNFDKSPPNGGYSQTIADGGGQGQPSAYSQKNTENVEKIEELKNEIYNLQNIINGLNTPNYTQKPEDKATVANLERQINELNSIINSLSQDITPNALTYLPNPPSIDQSTPPAPLTPQQQGYERLSRRRRDVENKEAENDGTQFYDQAVSKLKQLIFEKENTTQERSSYDDIQQRIADLRYQLESNMQTTKKAEARHFNPIYPTHLQNAYQPPYYQYIPVTKPAHTDKFDLIKTKKNDIFTSIVLKILDKIIAATPAVIEKLFGQGIFELTNFGDSYSQGGNYGDYNAAYGGQTTVQSLFKSLGFFGYGPLILLKIIDGLTTFVNILKRNKFFRTFLVPALVVLLVAGALIFLVWWLQPNDDVFGISGSSDSQGYGYNNNYYYGKNNEQYSNNNYQNGGYNSNYGPKSYNRPVYSRSYFENGPKSTFV